ncbi:hypothetical protein Pan216_04020 [Planctomycetes bacterium Pan216]|uniref:DNA polymerase III subunit beta n=1 Tax=Kolteria novifilia TaxID=2527975 RepID=A0A518AXX2_9BACT|nr:hypothetical protein Pan216_04020 [Planctomycetes bacterium Pan216]
MITISRSLVRRLRIAFARGLGAKVRKHVPSVQVQTGDRGIFVRAKNDRCAIAFHMPGTFEAHRFALPFEALKQCEGPKSEEVTLTTTDREVVLQWIASRVPQSVRFPLKDAEDFPPLPDQMESNSSHLLDALREAVAVASDENTRYALDHLQLRGDRGQVVATDGRQLLAQGGFSFPWDDDLLIPANRLFASSDLGGHETVQIGTKEDWVVIRSGPWTLWGHVAKTARFPKLGDLLTPNRTNASALLLADGDAAFLAEAVERLPGNDASNSPVTVDLNGSVAIRSQGAGDAQPTEIVLTNSRRDGDAISWSTHREHLRRAARLGFRRIGVVDQEAPICCQDEDRIYVWASLGTYGLVSSSTDAIRIESPTRDTKRSTQANQPQSTERNTSMIKSNSQSSEKHEETADQQSVNDMLEAAEALKGSLRQALADTYVLIAGLKKQRKQSKILRSAVMSLRQLRGIDA